MTEEEEVFFKEVQRATRFSNEQLCTWTNHPDSSGCLVPFVPSWPQLMSARAPPPVGWTQTLHESDATPRVQRLDSSDLHSPPGGARVPPARLPPAERERETRGEGGGGESDVIELNFESV